jgi:hypothetical protein
MQSDDLAVRLAPVEALFRAHRCTYEFTDSSMYALTARRHAVIRQPKDDETEAGIRHELRRHVINGPCPRTGAHEPARVLDSENCLQCERDAWATAMTLAPFTYGMSSRMHYCLSTYRRSEFTPRPMAAAHSADRLMNFMETFAAPLQKKVEGEWRRELVATLQRELTDRPNSVTRCRALLAQAMK